MNTLNPNQFIPSPLHQHCLVYSSSSSSSSISFRTPLPIKASSSSSTPSSFPFTNTKTPKPKSLTPLSLLKPTLISTIAATSLFFTFNLKPAISAPLSPPPTLDETAKPLDEETTKPLHEKLLSIPSNVEILKILLENHIKNRQLANALGIIDKLMELEPDETEWYFLKSHLYVHNGDLELSKLGFKKVVLMDRYHIEAYRGLVTAATEDDSAEEMKEIEKMVEEGINMCKKENKESEMRDFKLLLAQIWVIQGKCDDALKVYEGLVDEEPGDYRPHLCQGMIYSMLRKKDEAEKYFEMYRGLVPQGHPKARFEFMMPT